jgi:hypothetical protein
MFRTRETELIPLSAVLESENPVLAARALRQRKELRREKLELADALSRRTADRLIGETRREIRRLTDRLEKQIFERDSIPKTSKQLKRLADRYTREMRQIELAFPVGKAAKLAKYLALQIDGLGLHRDKVERVLDMLMEGIKSANSAKQNEEKDETYIGTERCGQQRRTH